ncbi:MAG TPA: methionine--tRNA ligase [Patescibacteria group bacterium]|nr:methionine--tRNA ligase [Patescibacteria group bacterium]
MDKKNFYITTTLPYVNAEPHIGFALEIVQADVVARYRKLLGENVFFNFGTDEHGQKIYKKAVEQGKDPQSYCDEYAKKFDELKSALNLDYNNFIRTTDPHHIKAAQEFWNRCNKNGDIYKDKYEVKYCVGCELEKTESELVEGKCPLHPTQNLEIRSEENYFFKFSKYQKPLLEFYNTHPDFVVPDFRFNEIKSFVSEGLSDFSVSRLKSKMPWGIEVPNDPDHVMYVWFDALINYISALGWPEDQKKFSDFWPGLQVAGKDNLRQQSAMWQAMLLSAGLPNSKQIFIHGFITANGQKISKSLGNTVDPYELVQRNGTDAVRYYLLSNIHPFEDSDFTIEKFENIYNGELANGLGNLFARVTALIEKYCDGKVPEINQPPDNHPLRVDTAIHNWKKVWSDIDRSVPQFRFNEAINSIWKYISEADKYINENEIWKLAEKDVVKFNWAIYGLIDSLHQLAWQTYIFIPQTAQKIAKRLQIEKLLLNDINYKDSWTNIKPGTKIVKGEPLFPKLG